MSKISIKEWLNSVPKKPNRKWKLFRVISKFIENRRIDKVNEKLKKDFEWIKFQAKETNRDFYWFQLITQEIKMYITIGEKIDLNEFVWLCHRRGFNLVEQNYLQSIMEHIGLINWRIK